MDDLPAKGPTEAELDREEAATLAEMATALAGAATPVDAALPADEASPAAPGDASRMSPDRPAGRLSRFARASRARPAAIRGRLVGARPWVNVRSRLNPRTWTWRRRIAKRATALGLAAALVLTSNGSTAPLGVVAPSLSPDATAAARPGTTPASASALAQGSPAHGPIAAASKPRPTATPTEGPLPASTSPTATITFRQIVLDGSTDVAGSARSFSFVSDGPGTVSAEIVETSPLDSTTLCVAVNETLPVCATGATPSFTSHGTTAHSQWTVTLASPNKSSPTVDVAFRWPTDHPSITLSGARFQGSPNPDSMRTLTADFTTRLSGSLRVDAAWSRIAVDATLSLADLSGVKPVTLGTAAYTGEVSISPSYTHLLTGGRTYEVKLYNNGRDAGRTLLTATIAFP